MKKITRRSFLNVCAAVGITTALTACGNAAGTSTASSSAASSAAAASAAGSVDTSANDESIKSTDYDNSVVMDSLTYIQDTDITSLVPWDVRTLTPGIVYAFYEMLYGIDAGGEFYPVLADASRGSFMPGMDHEAGSGDYTVYIYDNITDSAGNKITANDVKFCFDKARDGGFESGWGAFESEDVTDDTTLVMHCSGELSKMGELQNIVCRTYIYAEAALNASASGFANDACGTGPYAVTAFTPSTELKVTKRDDYWQTDESKRQQIQQANIKEITMSILNESTQKIVGLETGTINIGEKMTSDDVAQLKTDGYGDKFKTYASQSNMIVYAYCNNDSASLCSNLSLRKAILMALDTDALAAFVGNGMIGCKALGNTFYSDYDTEWEGKYSLYQPADASKIQSLLSDAGYNGETLQLLTATYCGEYAEVIQSQLAAYGINVELNIMDGGTCNTMKADPKEWDLFYQYMAADDYVVNLWSHLIDADGSGSGSGATANFIVDDTLQDKLHTCMTEASHTAENMADFLQYVDDNAYVKALCTGNSYLIYPDTVKTGFWSDKGYIIPSAFTFKQ